MIFSRRKYKNHFYVYFDDYIIAFVPNASYLGIALDTKHRGLPHITYLNLIVSRWSEFLRSIN